MTTDTGIMKTELGKVMFKVERKPARPEALFYEVMLSPFNTIQEAAAYIDKYKQYYPVEDRVYKISELEVSQIVQS